MFLETADRIGARLCRDAIWSGRRCNWLGVYDETCLALEPTVYKGASGIALFLLRLSAATGEKIFRTTAEGALRQALSRIDEVRAARRIGFYDGIAGIAYVASIAGATYVEESLRLARELTAEGARLDIINGSAGVLAALLSLYRCHGDDFLLDLALRHGHSLVDRANRTDTGWSWKTLDRQERDLTGFAHGAAGIAWALLELFHVTGEETFHCAALEGFRYERSLYRPDEENWPDLRDMAGGEEPKCAVMWCHGAPGIGFSRLRAWQILGDEIFREEASAAIRTTSRALSDTREGNFSLCHGRAGNADLLLYAGPEYSSPARRVGEMGIEMYENERVPWPCGAPGGEETPDLMLGLAGIGYFYLRLHDPLQTPSVLMIAPE